MFLLPGSSDEAVIALINQANPLPVSLTPGGLYYGHVKKLANGNIEVPTTAMYDNDSYEGYSTFQYRRVNLNVAFQGIVPIVQDLGQTSLHRLLPTINKNLGINLMPRDIIDQPISWLGGNEQANFVFRAQPESLGYEGAFIVQFKRIRPLLSSILERNAEVLTHPILVADGKQSLAMKTWGIDFTDDQAALVVNQGNGKWLDQVKFNAMIATHGFTGWPTAAAKDVALYPTALLPTANQDFDFVAVQKNVVVGDFKGDAYFHYNRL